MRRGKQRGPLLLFEYSKAQSIYLYRTPQCAPPPPYNGGGAHWPAGVGGGGVPIPTTGEKA